MKKHLYFVNPLVDAFFIGGLSLLVFAYFEFFYKGYSSLQVSDSSLAAAGIAAWLINHPHFSATSYRFYQSREHVRQFPLTGFLLPVFILAGTLACFAWPKEFAPAWTKVYVFWSVYHYSGQNLGLTMIYARRAGLEVSPAWRRALAIFLYSCFVAQYAAVEAMGGSIWVFGIRFPLMEVPHWFVWVATGLAYASGAVVLFHAGRWWRNHGAIPWIVALPALTQLSWTIVGAHNFSYQALLPLFHGLQYLFVAWAMEMHAKSKTAGARDSWQFFSWVTGRWAVLNLAIAAFLFNGLPRLVTLFGFDLSFNLAVFFVSIQIHHFFVDGVIWKLRREGEASPLFRHFRFAYAKEGG